MWHISILKQTKEWATYNYLNINDIFEFIISYPIYPNNIQMRNFKK